MRVRTRRVSSIVLALLASMVLQAQPGTTGDDAAVRARLAAYADARNRRDAHAEALCYTLDGDFRSSLGPFVSGRAAIEKQLTVTNPDYRFGLEITSVRLLTPQVAVADAEVMAGPSARQAKLVGTYVMVKQNGDWLISAARIAPAPAPRWRKSRTVRLKPDTT